MLLLRMLQWRLSWRPLLPWATCRLQVYSYVRVTNIFLCSVMWSYFTVCWPTRESPARRQLWWKFYINLLLTLTLTSTKPIEMPCGLADLCAPSELCIGRVSYIRIYLCYFCFRWKTVSLVQASMQYLMHHVTVSLQQSKITLQNNCINNTSITHTTLSFYLWLKM